MRSHLAHRTRRTLLLSLVSLFVMGSLPATGHAAEKGLQTDLTWGISNADQDRTIAGLQDLGARWQRLTMPWHDIETRNDSYTGLSRYDQAVDKAAASGIKLIVTVHSAPDWASGTTDRESPPLNPADYADFMSFVAARYRGKVQAWEIWNEENTKGFWSTGPDPAHYARMLKAAYPAVKAADPSALVVYGGTWENDYAYLEGAYAAVPDLGNYFDVLGTHPYVGSTSPDLASVEPDGRIADWSFAGYRELRNTMTNHGDDKPIWFTEFGWSTYSGAWGVSEATQAAYLGLALNCIEQDPYVQVAIVYAFRNHAQGADGDTWEYQLGLTHTDFSPKPAYDVFKSYTPDSGGCTYIDRARSAPLTPPRTTPGTPPGTTPDPGTPPVPDPLAETLGAAPAGSTSQLPASRWAGAGASSKAAPMLGVRNAQVQGDEVVISAHVARGATGKVRGVAAYGDVVRKFSMPVGPQGKLAARIPLAPGSEPETVWVGLAYMGNARFRPQSVFLHAAPLRGGLRVEPVAGTSATGKAWAVHGVVNPLARGRVMMLLGFRAADGHVVMRLARPYIAAGRFQRTFVLPAKASDAELLVVFPGDPKHGVGGASATIKPPVG